MVLETVRLSSAPRIDNNGGSTVYFKIFKHDGTLIYDSRSTAPALYMQGSSKVFSIPSNARVASDAKTVFYNEQAYGSDEKLFHCWIDPRFLEDGNMFLSLSKYQLDKVHFFF